MAMCSNYRYAVHRRCAHGRHAGRVDRVTLGRIFRYAAHGNDHPTVKEMPEDRYKVAQRAVGIKREPGEA